jgi:nucleotide-binding universal stress UspA family protein
MTLRLLVPVDERLGSIRTINYLIKNKDLLKPVISLLTIYDVSIIEGHGITEEFQEKITENAKKLAEKTVNEYKEKLEKAGILVENAYFVQGKPGEAICEESEKLNVNMIVLSPNNASELANILMGSVTHYVIHHSNFPVLLVK